MIPLFKKIERRIERIMDERVRDAIKERRIGMAETENQSQKPVAYDANGHPLYAAPVNQAMDSLQAQVVHVARSAEPVPVQVSDEIRKRHEDSVAQYPWLNLSEHEYVIAAVPRHPIGMLAPFSITAIVSALVLVALIYYPELSTPLGFTSASAPLAYVIGGLLIVAFILGGYLAMWVFANNRFFLTNESVIQEIQMSIFSKREQTVSLMNIEDASFTQRGPLQILLNYGSIRLSTEGDETTYRFDYVANPRHHIATLNNAVEAFKNGRPVQDD